MEEIDQSYSELVADFLDSQNVPYKYGKSIEFYVGDVTYGFNFDIDNSPKSIYREIESENCTEIMCLSLDNGRSQISIRYDHNDHRILHEAKYLENGLLNHVTAVASNNNYLTVSLKNAHVNYDQDNINVSIGSDMGDQEPPRDYEVGIRTEENGFGIEVGEKDFPDDGITYAFSTLPARQQIEKIIDIIEASRQFPVGVVKR